LISFKVYPQEIPRSILRLRRGVARGNKHETAEEAWKFPIGQTGIQQERLQPPVGDCSLYLYRLKPGMA
jgi:hypothetical protein